jgi:hypothetical protein
LRQPGTVHRASGSEASEQSYESASMHRWSVTQRLMDVEAGYGEMPGSVRSPPAPLGPEAELGVGCDLEHGAPRNSVVA